MRILAAIGLAMSGLGGPAQQQDWSHAIEEWTAPMAPFRIAGNLYYVGTGGISAFLITGSKGPILIDGALPQSAGVIAAHIRALGFRVEDVRYILINHAHFDHSGGLAELKRLSGAKLLASAADKPDLEAGKTIGRTDLLDFPAVRVDRVIRDGEHIRLGEIDLTTILTPGHTPGCTSWAMRVMEGGKPLDVVMACSLTVAGQKLVGNARYPGAAKDFRASFAKLRKRRADIFLSFHPGIFDMERKRQRLMAGDPLAFVDADELARRVDAAAAAFEKTYDAERNAAKR